MGYSIAAPMKSKKAKNKMTAFMKKHYRGPKDVFGESHQNFLDEGPTSDLSYDDFSLSYGFNYSVGTHMVDSEYAHAIVMWMSAKGGRTRKIQEGQVEKYYRYDGDEVLTLRDEEIGWIPAKKDGILGVILSWSLGLSKKNVKKIEAEIKRLDDLWYWRT